MFNFNDKNGYSNYGLDATKVEMQFNTLQKARKDLIGEIQAVIEYDEHIHTSADRLAIETWENIKHEELVHIGELLGLLNYLDPTQKQFVQKGITEFLGQQK